MSVALAMVVRNEADLVEQHLSFHLSVGIDVVLATDHGSQDGTREVLERFAADGAVRLFRGEGVFVRQGEWMTRMARFGAEELGVDWVLCSDGDEFWWPAGGSVRDVLAAVPARFGVLHVLSQSFVPVPEDGRPFAERMTLRLSPTAPISDPATPYRPVSKVAHRGEPAARISNGNHEVQGVTGAALRGWLPLEILHFPLRTSEQFARKYRKTWEGWAVNPRADLARARQHAADERLDTMYRRLVVGEAAAARGLRDGTLVRDTRLRDALRATSGGPGARDDTWRHALNGHLPFEVAVLAEAEMIRLQRRVEQARLTVEGAYRDPSSARRAQGHAIRLRRP